jgi:hypothetical protein
MHTNPGSATAAPLVVFPRPAAAMDTDAPLDPPSPRSYPLKTTRPPAPRSHWLSSAFVEGDLTHDSDFGGGEDEDEINELYQDRIAEDQLNIDADEVRLLPGDNHFCLFDFAKVADNLARKTQPSARIRKRGGGTASTRLAPPPKRRRVEVRAPPMGASSSSSSSDRAPKSTRKVPSFRLPALEIIS